MRAGRSWAGVSDDATAARLNATSHRFIHVSLDGGDSNARNVFRRWPLHHESQLNRRHLRGVVMTRTRIALNVRRSLGLASIAALLAAPHAWAGIEPTPFRTGLFGVMAGQTIRVSVLNAGEARG